MCTYIYIYTYTCIYIYIYTHTPSLLLLVVLIHVCMYVCMYVCIYIYIYIYIHIEHRAPHDELELLVGGGGAYWTARWSCSAYALITISLTHSLAPYQRRVALAARLIIGLESHARALPERLYVHRRLGPGSYISQS